METTPPFGMAPETTSHYIPEDILSSEVFINSRRMVLRCLATLRLQDRRAAGGSGEPFEAADWRPDAERLYHLGDESLEQPLAGAHRIGRFLGMAENFARYREHIEHIGLRPEDQVEPFEALVDFYHPAELGEQLPLDVTLAHVLGGAYGKMATGWGKMAVLAKYAEAAGIGQHPFNDPAIAPYKAFILAGDKVNLKQLIGHEVFDGFAKFAPDISLSEYSGQKKDLTGDGVAMSYLMFERATREERYDPDMFDIVLPDEAHHLLGSNIRASHDVLRQAGIPTMAVTATPNYRADHALRQLLPYELCDINKRDLIELGTLSGVQLFWVTTGKTLKVQERRGDYKEAEVAGLAHDDERNAQIMEWAKLLVEDGRQTVVTSIRGDKCWHAKHLASMASNLAQYKILDPETGELRQMVGVAVHGYMSDKDIDAIMQGWEAGTIDVLFVTDKFRESWNSSKVGAMVFAAPTASDLVMDQWTGRALRQNPDVPIKILVHLDDTILGHKPKVTPYHVLGETMIEQGVILASPRHKRRNSQKEGGSAKTTGQRGKSTRAVDDYPAHLVRMLQVEGLLLSEVEITARSEAYLPPPKDYIPVKDTAALWQGQSFDEICRILAKNGYPYLIAKGRRGPMRHAHQDARAFLHTYTLPSFATKSVATATTGAIRCGISQPYFLTVAEILNLESAEYRLKKTGQIFDHYTNEQVEAVKAYVTEKKVSGEEEPIRAIGEEFGLVLTSMIYHVRKVEGDPIVTRQRRMLSGQHAIVVSKADAKRIRTYLQETQITTENARQPLPAIMAATTASRQVVIQWAKEMAKRGYLHRDMRRGRVQNPETGFLESVKFLEADDAAKLTRAITYHLKRGGKRYELAPDSWTKSAPVLEPVQTYQPKQADTARKRQSFVAAGAEEAIGAEAPAAFMTRMNCTSPAMRYLIGAARITKDDMIQVEGSDSAMLRYRAILRLTKLTDTAAKRPAPMSWMSNTMFAARTGLPPEDVLQRIRRRVGINEGEVHIAMGEGQVLDIWYTESLWRRAHRMFSESYVES
jgi:superfamily II DNA or RNA helicase